MRHRPEHPPLDVDAIANFFIWQAHETGEPITHLKLQKLVYYAQAWYLALYDERLVESSFEAWVHGPVNRALYQRFRDRRWKAIDDTVSEPDLPEKVHEHLAEVWEVYGGLSALDLERLTHAEAPWLKARDGLAPDAYGDAEISEREMKDYYRRVLDGANSASERS